MDIASDIDTKLLAQIYAYSPNLHRSSLAEKKEIRKKLYEQLVKARPVVPLEKYQVHKLLVHIEENLKKCKDFGIIETSNEAYEAFQRRYQIMDVKTPQLSDQSDDEDDRMRETLQSFQRSPLLQDKAANSDPDDDLPLAKRREPRKRHFECLNDSIHHNLSNVDKSIKSNNGKVSSRNSIDPMTFNIAVPSMIHAAERKLKFSIDLGNLDLTRLVIASAVQDTPLGNNCGKDYGNNSNTQSALCEPQIKTNTVQDYGEVANDEDLSSFISDVLMESESRETLCATNVLENINNNVETNYNSKKNELISSEKVKKCKSYRNNFSPVNFSRPDVSLKNKQPRKHSGKIKKTSDLPKVPKKRGRKPKPKNLEEIKGDTEKSELAKYVELFSNICDIPSVPASVTPLSNTSYMVTSTTQNLDTTEQITNVAQTAQIAYLLNGEWTDGGICQLISPVTVGNNLDMGAIVQDNFNMNTQFEDFVNYIDSSNSDGGNNVIARVLDANNIVSTNANILDVANIVPPRQSNVVEHIIKLPNGVITNPVACHNLDSYTAIKSRGSSAIDFQTPTSISRINRNSYLPLQTALIQDEVLDLSKKSEPHRSEVFVQRNTYTADRNCDPIDLSLKNKRCEIPQKGSIIIPQTNSDNESDDTFLRRLLENNFDYKIDETTETVDRTDHLFDTLINANESFKAALDMPLLDNGESLAEKSSISHTEKSDKKEATRDVKDDDNFSKSVNDESNENYALPPLTFIQDNDETGTLEKHKASKCFSGECTIEGIKNIEQIVPLHNDSKGDLRPPPTMSLILRQDGASNNVCNSRLELETVKDINRNFEILNAKNNNIRSRDMEVSIENGSKSLKRAYTLEFCVEPNFETFSFDANKKAKVTNMSMETSKEDDIMPTLETISGTDQRYNESIKESTSENTVLEAQSTKDNKIIENNNIQIGSIEFDQNLIAENKNHEAETSINITSVENNARFLNNDTPILVEVAEFNKIKENKDVFKTSNESDNKVNLNKEYESLHEIGDPTGGNDKIVDLAEHIECKEKKGDYKFLANDLIMETSENSEHGQSGQNMDSLDTVQNLVISGIKGANNSVKIDNIEKSVENEGRHTPKLQIISIVSIESIVSKEDDNEFIRRTLNKDSKNTDPELLNIRNSLEKIHYKQYTNNKNKVLHNIDETNSEINQKVKESISNDFSNIIGDNREISSLISPSSNVKTDISHEDSTTKTNSNLAVKFSATRIDSLKNISDSIANNTEVATKRNNDSRTENDPILHQINNDIALGVCNEETNMEIEFVDVDNFDQKNTFYTTSGEILCRSNGNASNKIDDPKEKSKLGISNINQDTKSRKITHEDKDKYNITEIAKEENRSAEISDSSNKQSLCLLNFSVLELEEKYDDSYLDYDCQLEDDVISLATSCFNSPEDDRYSSSKLVDEPEVSSSYSNVKSNDITILQTESSKNDTPDNNLANLNESPPPDPLNAITKFKIPKLASTKVQELPELTNELVLKNNYLNKIVRNVQNICAVPPLPLQHSMTFSTTNCSIISQINSNFLSTTPSITSHHMLDKKNECESFAADITSHKSDFNVVPRGQFAGKGGEAISCGAAVLDIAKIFGTTCLSFLVDECPIVVSSLQHSHQFRESTVVQNALEGLPKNIISIAYKFMFNHSKLFRRYFFVFCNVYSKLNNRNKLLNMVYDCEKHSGCIFLLRTIFYSLIDCGLNKINACRQILSRSRDKSSATIDVLISIIFEADWGMFSDYLERFADIPHYNFRINLLNEMAGRVLRTKDSRLTSVVWKCLLTLNQEDYRLVNRTPDLIALLELVKNGKAC